VTVLTLLDVYGSAAPFTWRAFLAWSVFVLVLAIYCVCAAAGAVQGSRRKRW
jgi:hypothetical protein